MKKLKEGSKKYYKETIAEKNRAQCKVRNEKGDVWCADSCIDRDTCPYSAK